ncbi:flagellar brake protein [Gammaproteobacteria bacterium]
MEVMAVASTDPTSTDLAGSDYEEITGDGPVLRTIDRIRAGRALLHIRILDKENPDASGDSFISTVVGVDMVRRTWELDGLHSKEGHQRLRQARSFSVGTRLDGVIVRFQAEVIGVTKQDEFLYYQVSAPRSVRIYQRRSFFRAPLGAQHQAILTVSIPGFKVMRGQVRDLSQSGLGAVFKQSGQLFHTGLYIPDSSLVLPDGTDIRSAIEVRSTRHSDVGLSLGAAFDDLSAADQRVLVRFISFLDREWCRRGRS